MALTDLDRRLLKQCLARTPGAWEDFVDRYLGLIVHVIRHTSHARSAPLSPDDVDDLCSEVLVAILRDDFAVLRNFRGESSLSTYLTVISRRIVVKEISRRRKAEAMGHVMAHQAALDGAPDVRPEADQLERVDEVRQLLDRLPPDDARVVRMFYLEGHGYKRISAELGIPENSIGPILSRARELLRPTRAASAV